MFKNRKYKVNLSSCFVDDEKHIRVVEKTQIVSEITPQDRWILEKGIIELLRKPLPNRSFWRIDSIEWIDAEAAERDAVNIKNGFDREYNSWFEEKLERALMAVVLGRKHRDPFFMWASETGGYELSEGWNLEKAEDLCLSEDHNACRELLKMLSMLGIPEANGASVCGNCYNLAVEYLTLRCTGMMLDSYYSRTAENNAMRLAREGKWEDSDA